MSSDTRQDAPECPNCCDGRMTVHGDGGMWCDRCEVPQLTAPPQQPFGNDLFYQAIGEACGHVDCFEDLLESAPAGWRRAQMAKAAKDLTYTLHVLETRFKVMATALSTALTPPTPAPKPILYCDNCDGCGWYEGGEALQTTCEKCGGTGIVSDKGAKQ